MKLRINGNSIRLRLLRSEVAAFIETSRIDGRVQFGPGNDAFLVYAMVCEAGLQGVEVRYQASEVVVVVPRETTMQWAQSEQVGIYAEVSIGSHGSLEVAIEKDFACLDLSDAENEDTFPNPQVGTVC